MLQVPNLAIQCDNCSHSRVCAYKEKYKNLIEEVQAVGNEDHEIFNVNVTCNYYHIPIGNIRGMNPPE